MRRSLEAVLAKDLRVLTYIALSLFALCVAVAFSLGAPLVMPKGESPALGVDPSLPMIATVALYAALRGVRYSLRGEADRETIRREVLEDLYLLGIFGFVSLIHFHFKMWIPLLNETRFDATFFAIDQDFRPLIESLAALREGLASVMPFPDRWYDVVYFSIFPVAYCSHTLGDRRWFYPMMIAVTLIHAWGALLYLVAPAAGPFIFEQGVNPRATEAQQQMYEQYQMMRAGGVAYLDQYASTYFTSPVAAMPSLHVAASISLAYYAVRGRIWIAPLAVYVAFWMPIEAVVSRWHYLVDLPAGLIIAAMVIGFTNRLCRFRVEGAHVASESRVLSGSPSRA